MDWYNEPPQWHYSGNSLQVTAGPKTDFWQKTHYGFQRDNGHFYAQTINGNFTAEIKVTGEYNHLYDQAGLMLRVDVENWIKCGIEYVDGIQKASVVVTREFSDWSVLDLPDGTEAIWLRLVRDGDAVEIFYSFDDETYHMMRTAYFPTVESVQVGPMCAAPDGNGFNVVFEDFRIRGKVE